MKIAEAEGAKLVAAAVRKAGAEAAEIVKTAKAPASDSDGAAGPPKPGEGKSETARRQTGMQRTPTSAPTSTTERAHRPDRREPDVTEAEKANLRARKAEADLDAKREARAN